MAAEAATAAAAARPAAPPPSPDPRVIGPAGRLGAFYTTLVARRPRARGLDLLPAERRGGRCIAQIGLGVGFARSVDYAAAVVVTYGPGVVGERDLAGARTRIQGWIDEYWQARDWDPVAGKETAKLYEIDTTAFRADFDVVIPAVDAAGPRVVSALLGELGGVLREKLLAITPQWCAIINRKLEKDRAPLLEMVPSGRHIHEDSFEVYLFSGEAGRRKFAPTVRAINDPLLSTLFVQPDGLAVLRSLARSPDDGARAARGVVAAALDALEEFRRVIGADVHWRYPEFIPPVLEGLGLGKVTGLADYLTVIADGQVNRTVAESAVEIGGLALMALGLLFSEGAAGVAVSGAGVAVSGLNLGLAFIEERNRTFAVDAYGLESGERQLFTPRFPVGTALAAAATVIAAVGFFFAVRGRVPSPPPPRPGAPRPPAPSGVRGSAPPAKPSPTSPAARAVDPSSRLTGKSQKGNGSWRTNEPPRPYASVPPGEPAAGAPSGTSSPPPSPPPPPPPTAPRPPRRPAGAPRGGSEEATGGRPQPPDRSTGRVRPPERAVPRDPEQVARDAVRALDAKLRDFAINYRAARERIADVLAELDNVPANAELVKRLEVATAALEDPAAFGRLVAELDEQLRLVAGTPRADWEIALGLETDELRAAARVAGINAETSGSFHTVTRNMTPAEFFDEVVVDGRGFVDIEYSTEDHSALAHALQERLVGDRLAQEGLGTVGELRAMLGQAKPPSGWDEAVKGKIGATAWTEIWDSMGDRLGESGLHSPEFFTRLLKDGYPGLVLQTKPTLQP